MDHDNATNLKQPSKSILKTSSSFDQQEKPPKNKNAKWDEMNILQTYHPPDKDYGHMKVEEPKTPYNWEYNDDVTESTVLDPALLHQKMATASTSRRRSTPSASEDESEDDSHLDESEQAKRREFKNRRKAHYNEFNAVQMARRLIAEEEEEPVEDEPGGSDTQTTADEV